MGDSIDPRPWEMGRTRGLKVECRCDAGGDATHVVTPQGEWVAIQPVDPARRCTRYTYRWDAATGTCTLMEPKAGERTA